MVKRKLYNEFVRFILVGIFNTLLGLATMYGFYFLGFGYWGSSGLSYTMGSIISFFLNKHFTFKNNEAYFTTGIKFALNIGVCYFIAYLLAKPLVLSLLIYLGYDYNINIIEKIALLVGMVLFTGLNFLGQRLLVFRKKEDPIGEKS